MKITVDTDEVYRLGTTKALLLGILRKEPETTPQQLKWILGVSDIAIYPNLRALEEEGYIEMHRKSDKKQSTIIRIEVVK